MREKLVTKRDVAGWVLGPLVASAIAGAIGYYNGSLPIVWGFASSHPVESALWSALFLLIGVAIGAFARGCLDATKINEMTAKISELEAEPENNSDDDGVQMLTGEDALNFIRSLTDNQKSILAEIYDSGGSISADPFDGDLSQLRTYGLVSMPPIVAPGMPCKWSIPPNVNRILCDNPDLLEVDSKEIEPTPKGISSLSSIMAHAVWSAYEHGDMPIGEAHEEVWASIIDGDGIFERVCHPYMGARNPTDKYRLTSKWRIALKDEATLNLVKIAARGY